MCVWCVCVCVCGNVCVCVDDMTIHTHLLHYTHTHHIYTVYKYYYWLLPHYLLLNYAYQYSIVCVMWPNTYCTVTCSARVTHWRWWWWWWCGACCGRAFTDDDVAAVLLPPPFFAGGYLLAYGLPALPWRSAIPCLFCHRRDWYRCIGRPGGVVLMVVINAVTFCVRWCRWLLMMIVLMMVL